MGGCSDSGEQGMLRVPELSAAPAHSPGGGAMGGRGTKTTTDSELCVCVNVLLLFILMLLGKVSQMSIKWNLQKY